MQSVPITTKVASVNPTQSGCTRYNIMWYSLSVTCACRWFSSDIPVSSINKTDRHDIAEILLKVALSITASTLNIGCADKNVISLERSDMILWRTVDMYNGEVSTCVSVVCQSVQSDHCRLRTCYVNWLRFPLYDNYIWATLLYFYIL